MCPQIPTDTMNKLLIITVLVALLSISKYTYMFLSQHTSHFPLLCPQLGPPPEKACQSTMYSTCTSPNSQQTDAPEEPDISEVSYSLNCLLSVLLRCRERPCGETGRGGGRGPRRGRSGGRNPGQDLILCQDLLQQLHGYCHWISGQHQGTETGGEGQVRHKHTRTQTHKIQMQMLACKQGSEF